MTKIYAQGNYIVIEANNERKTFQKKGVGFEIVNYDGLYSLNDKGLPIGDFNYSEVKKEDGSGYATPLEFEKFLFENTGNFNSGADVSPNAIGSLKIADTAPTTQGLYILSDVGTYTNLGGLVTTTGKINYAYFDGTTWKLISVDIPNFVAPIDALNSTSTTAPLSANQGKVLSGLVDLVRTENWTAKSFSQGKKVFYDNEIFEATANVTATDIPNISNLWQKISGVNAKLVELFSNKQTKIIGKNILNPKDSNLVINAILEANGKTTSANGFFVTGYIPVNSGDVLSFNFSTGNLRYIFYDKNLKILSVNITSTNTVTALSDGYLRVTISGNPTTGSFQIEKSQTPTSYEAYQENKDVYDYIKKLHPNWTNDDTINNKIKTIYLENLNPSKEYEIIELANRSDGYKILRIREVGGVEVARVITNSSPISNKYYEVQQYNSSGISGYCMIDLSSIYNYQTSSYLLNKSMISNHTDEYKKFFQSDFETIDETIRVNKLKPSKIIWGKTFEFSNSNLLTSNINSNFFSIAGIFPIKANEYITISNVEMYQSNCYIINSYRKILKTINITSNTNSISILNDKGVDAWLAIRVRLNGKVFNGEYPQIEYNSVSTDYESYLENPIIENKFEIALPKLVYVLKNTPFNIYKKSIINTHPLEFHDVTLKKLDAYNSESVVPSYKRQFNNTISTAGVINYVFRVNENKLVKGKATRQVVVQEKTTGTINVLALGDSLTDIGHWVQTIKDNAIADGQTMNLMGLKKEIYHSENQTGGTLSNSFMVSRENAFLLSVTGFLNDGCSDGFGATVFTDGTSQYQFDGRKVNASGNGLIRLVPVSGHSNEPMPNGVLTKVSGASNFTTINYGTVEKINRNPFWNPSTNAIDFQYYFQKFNYENELNLTTSKLLLIIQFTWNDLKINYDASNISEVVSNIKTMIDLIKLQYPNVKVIIGVEPSGSTQGGGNIMWRQAGVQWCRAEFIKALSNQFEISPYSSFVFLNPTYAFVDVDNAFDTTNVALSSRFPSILDSVISDGVHPNQAGMQQIGDSYRALIHKVIST